MSTSDELWIAGRRILNGNFIGVFPLDKLPPLSSIRSPSSFILNTQTANLPGQHWIAVAVLNRRIYVFDPLGAHSYPHYLVHYLHKDLKRRVIYNTRVIQNPMTNTCGQHCIQWLKGMCISLSIC